MSERDTHIPAIDSFLYLHPSENPAVSLVSPVLDSTNYHSWSRSMMTALSAKNKLEFVDGGAAEPLKTDRTYGAWKRSNKIIPKLSPFPNTNSHLHLSPHCHSHPPRPPPSPTFLLLHVSLASSLHECLGLLQQWLSLLDPPSI